MSIRTDIVIVDLEVTSLSALLRRQLVLERVDVQRLVCSETLTVGTSRGLLVAYFVVHYATYLR